MKAKDRRNQNKQGCCAGCGKTVKVVADSYPIDSLKIKPIDSNGQYDSESVGYRTDDYVHRSNGPTSPPSSQCLDEYGRRVLFPRVPNTRDYRNGAVAVVNDEHQIIVKR